MVVEQDLRSRVRKLQRDGTTDAARAAGDQRSLSFQQAHGLSLYVQIIAGWNRQRDREQGASAGAGGSFYIARVLAQNRFTNAQAQACSAPRPLSRIERVEDVGQDLHRNAGTIILKNCGDRVGSVLQTNS